jgi:hypothetical protein
MSTATDDPELARLVADMAVMQTPAPRRSEGVMGVGAQINDHGVTNGTFSSDSSTIFGNPVTVLLEYACHVTCA